MLTKNKRVSIFTALFFGLHPVQVESVAWISERKTLLFFFFGFLSLITYLKGKKPFYIFSLFFFLCSLLSKSHAVIIPFLLLLIDIFQDKIDRKKFLEKIPYFIFTIIFSIITILSQARVGGIKEPFGGSFTSHLFTMAKAFLLYFRNIFFPFYLNNYYNIHPVTNFFSISAIFSLIFIILILFITILSFKRNKRIFFSLSWFFIALLPVSNIIPISIVMADRYLYLPIIGIAFLLANLFFNQEKKKVPLFIYIFVSVIIVTLIGLTVQRNKVWHDSISLWQDSLKKDSKNSKAWDMLGVAFYNKKEYINAKNSFIKAKSLNPFEPEVYVHLGELYFRLNKPIKAFLQSIQRILLKILRRLRRFNKKASLKLLQRSMILVQRQLILVVQNLRILAFGNQLIVLGNAIFYNKAWRKPFETVNTFGFGCFTEEFTGSVLLLINSFSVCH